VVALLKTGSAFLLPCVGLLANGRVDLRPEAGPAVLRLPHGEFGVRGTCRVPPCWVPAAWKGGSSQAQRREQAMMDKWCRREGLVSTLK